MILPLAYILVVLSGASGMSLYQTCTTNRDCTQPNTYCYASGRCVDCTDCSRYNRFPGTVCATDKNQCGKCLPGMEPEYNLDQTLTCNPPGTSTSSTQTPGPDPPDRIFTVPVILAGVAVLLVFLCGFIICLYKYTNSCVIIRNIFSFCPNNNLMNTGSGGCSKCPDNFPEHPQPPASGPPPYYSERSPTAPPFEDPPATDSVPPICQKVYTPIENDPSQTANAYINPHYIRGGNLGTNPQSTEPEEELEAAEDDALINASSISQPDDEETQPSTWTPSPGSETGSTTGPTSFAGALSLQQLRISQPDVTLAMQQGSSARSNSHPSIQFNTQNSSDNSENSDRSGGPQQSNIINVGIFINQSK